MFEQLNDWELFLNDYRNHLNHIDADAVQLSKLRSLNSLCEWDEIIRDEPMVCRNREMAAMAASASMHLQKWDKLGFFQEAIGSDDKDSKFYESVSAIVKQDYPRARDCRREMEGR